jgi:hypothetical protein
MTTDGYVKVDGDQLAADLAPNFEELKFLRAWEAADVANKKFDLDRETLAKQEKAISLRWYLRDGSAKLHFDLAKVFATEVVQKVNKILWMEYRQTVSERISEEKLIEALKAYNPNFWSKDTCLVLSKMFKFNFKEFSESYEISLSKASTEDKTRHYYYRHRLHKSKYDYLIERVAPFTKLSGEVLVNIDDYNLLKRFIVDIKSSYNWF